DLAIGSTGRVLADGTLVQTGGGDLTLKVGGALNPVTPGTVSSQLGDYFGSIADLRGDVVISAGSIGALSSTVFVSLDPRPVDSGVFTDALVFAGPTVTPGDGTVTITARGNLVLGGANDA